MRHGCLAQENSRCNEASCTFVKKKITAMPNTFKTTVSNMRTFPHSHGHKHRMERGRSLASLGITASESRHTRYDTSDTGRGPGTPKPSVSPLPFLRARSYQKGPTNLLPPPTPHTPPKGHSPPVSFVQRAKPITAPEGSPKVQRSHNRTPSRQPRHQPSYLNDTVASAARRKLSQHVDQEQHVGTARFPSSRRCSSVTHIQRMGSSIASCRSATRATCREGISPIRAPHALHGPVSRVSQNNSHVRVSSVLSSRRALDASLTTDTARQQLKTKAVTGPTSLPFEIIGAPRFGSCPIYPSPRSLGVSPNLFKPNKRPEHETLHTASSPKPSPTNMSSIPPTLLETHFHRPPSPPNQLYSEHKHCDMYPIYKPPLPTIQQPPEIKSCRDGPTSTVPSSTTATPQKNVQAKTSAVSTRCSTARSGSPQKMLPQLHQALSAHSVPATHNSTELKPPSSPSSSPSCSRVPPTGLSKELSPPNATAPPYPWALLHTLTDPTSLGPPASAIEPTALQPPQNESVIEKHTDNDVSAPQFTTQCCQYLEFDELPAPPPHIDPHTLRVMIYRALHGPEEAWKASFDALTQIQCLAKHDGNRFLIDTPILEENIEAIAQCILSLRSGLSRNAVLTIDTLTRCIPWGLERFLSYLVPPLLSRAALTSQKFVATLASGALERLCEKSTALRLLVALCAQPLRSRGRDFKNATQNQKKAILVKMCLEKLTAHAIALPRDLVHASPPTTEALDTSTQTPPPHANGLFHTDTLAPTLLSLSLLLEDRLSSTRKNAKDSVLLLFKAYKAQTPPDPPPHHAFTELLKQALLLTGDDTYAIKRHTRFLREVEDILKTATPDENRTIGSIQKET